MLIAWMVCASFSVLMPRYCKQAWPNRMWYGKKIWFQVCSFQFCSHTISIWCASYTVLDVMCYRCTVS